MAIKYRFSKSFWSNAARNMLCLTAAASFAVPASAEDWPLKAPPVMPDLTWQGITVIGAIDVSGQYEANGAPYKGIIYGPGSLIAPQNRAPEWIFAPNQSLQSFIGLKVEEHLASNLDFIARAEMGFNPTTGSIADALKSIQNNNGIALNQQDFNGDGGRQGQILNGEAWAGFASKTFGTVHIGRNNTALLDMLGAYDPLASYGFSLLAFNGTFVGQGSSETTRIDNSIKYLNNWGPFRVEAMYGSPDSNAKDIYQAAFGFVMPQFSVDVIAGQVHDGISVGALSSALPGALGSPFLGARVFDSKTYGVMAKYVFPLGGAGPLNTANSKFIVTGGFSYLDLSNPADGGRQPGFATSGGYLIGPALSLNGSSGSGIVNYTFTGGDRLVDTTFITGKYQYDDRFSFTLGYYRYDQNSYGHGVNSIPGVSASSFSNVYCSSAAFTNCAGSSQAVSFRADYQYTKNLMFYAGIAYSEVAGGMSFGFLKTYTYDPTVGLRFTF